MLGLVEEEMKKIEQGKKCESFDNLTKAKEKLDKAKEDPKKFRLFKSEIEQKMKEKLKDTIDEMGSTGKAGPLLVHCSAGVGRTGTFIAIDMLMDKLRWFGVESQIDIFNAVEHMRNYRMCTVQSSGQYEFIYKAMKCYVQSLLVSSYGDDDEVGGLMHFDKIKVRKNRYTIKNK